MTTTPLTERIAAAIGGHWPITALPNGTVLCHCGNRVKADRQRQAFREHTAAAVLAVVQPELDQLRTERDQACVRVDILAATARGDRAARRVSTEECTRLTTELDRVRAELATARAAAFREAARVLEHTGHDDDAVNLLDNIADGITSSVPGCGCKSAVHPGHYPSCPDRAVSPSA